MRRLRKRVITAHRLWKRKGSNRDGCDPEAAGATGALANGMKWAERLRHTGWGNQNISLQKGPRLK